MKLIRDYWDYANVLVSLIFDVLTAIKFYQINKNKEWSKQRATLERLFLLQVLNFLYKDTFRNPLLQGT